MGKNKIANLSLPIQTMNALDEAKTRLVFFNRSELANLAILEGLPRIVERLGQTPIPKSVSRSGNAMAEAIPA